MKNLILSILLACFFLIANAQPGTRISMMGETPGINLSDLGLKGPIKTVIELQYLGQMNESDVDTSKFSIEKIMKFDSKGNELEELQYGHNDRLLTKCSYDYTNLRTTVVNKFIQDTVILGKYNFVNDGRGEITEVDIFPRRLNTPAFKTLYKYNEKRNREEEITFAGLKDTLSKIIYQCDNQNQRILQSQYDYRGKLIGTITFTYDVSGNSTETQTSDMAGMIQSKTTTKHLKADKFGNWRLTTIEANSHGVIGDILYKTIIKRTILYY